MTLLLLLLLHDLYSANFEDQVRGAFVHRLNFNNNRVNSSAVCLDTFDMMCQVSLSNTLTQAGACMRVCAGANLLKAIFQLYVLSLGSTQSSK